MDVCEEKVRDIILFTKIGEVIRMFKNYIIRSFLLSALCICPFTADVSKQAVPPVVWCGMIQ